MIPQTPDIHQVREQEHVPVVVGAGQPLIVDWEPEVRTDMEVQMRDGVTVVSYTEEGLRLLKDCSVDGSYGFVQVAPKQQVIRLKSRDEVRANLPTTAGTMLRVHGDVGRERGIEIAMTIVGKFRTTRHRVTFPMLRGACQGATHFVRGATVGAFAMRASSGGWASSAAEVFGAELGAGARGERAIENRDGDPGACDASSQEALLSGCGALLRLELVAVDQGSGRAQASTDAEDPAAVALRNDCPEGFFEVGGKCAKKEKQKSYTCSPSNLSDCYRQCDAENARSCVIAGVRQRDGAPAEGSSTEAKALFERACAGGDPIGCTLLGDAYRFGSGVNRDVLRAGTHYGQGCDAGVVAACRQLGTMYYYGDGLNQELSRAVELYARGCNGGDHRSCALLGDLHMTASGAQHDPARAVELFQRACEGDDVAGCVSVVRAMEFGDGVPVDMPEVLARKHRLCDQDPALCGPLAMSYLAGRGVYKDERAASRFLLQSCRALSPHKPIDSWGEPDLYAFYSCLVSEHRFAQAGATAEHKATMAARVRPVLKLVGDRCQAASAFECFDAGYLHLLVGDEKGAHALWTRGCEFESSECCDLAQFHTRAVTSQHVPPPNPRAARAISPQE